MNLGNSSYSTILYERVFRDTALRLKPDLVIVCLDQTDMIDDELYAREFAEPEKRPFGRDLDTPFAATVLARLTKLPVRLWLYENSSLFFFFYLFSNEHLGFSPLPPIMASRDKERTALYTETSKSPDSHGSLFSRTAAYIQAIDREAVGKTRVLFVTFPRAEHLAGQTKWQRTASSFPPGSTSEVYLEHWVRKTNLSGQLLASKFFHATSAFRKGDRSGARLYRGPEDVHWTQAGHEFFADLLYPEILKHWSSSPQGRSYASQE